ncbi:MAG: hypothetical protein WBW33_10370 [Bryobacteraceae bacterium]
MRSLLRILTISGLSIAQCSQETSHEQPAQTYAVAEAYQVYSAILPDEWTWRYTNSQMFVIRAETVSYEMCLVPTGQYRELLKPAIADFRIENRKTRKLDRLLAISKPYELVGSDALAAPFAVSGQDGWSRFSSEHPGSVGWIEFSAVGFNEAKAIAVVYVGHHCGNACGGGGFNVLRKVNGKWKALSWTGQICAWAS